MTRVEAFEDAIHEALMMDRELIIVKTQNAVEYWSQLVVERREAERSNVSNEIMKEYSVELQAYVYYYIRDEKKRLVYAVH